MAKQQIGGVYKSGKYYYARWFVNGKKHQMSTHCTTERDALSFLARQTHSLTYETRKQQLEHLKADIVLYDREEEEYQRAHNKVHIEDLISRFLTVKGADTITHSTTELYEMVCRNLVAWMQERHKYLTGDIGSIDDTIAREYATYVKTEKGASSHNSYIKKLRTIWYTLAESAHLPTNPWKKVKILKVERCSKESLTQSEFEALEKVCSKSLELRFIFALASTTALRISDCCLLKWDYIKDRTLELIPHKIKKFGTKVIIPIPQTVAELLKEIPKTESEYVLPEMARQYHNGSLLRISRRLFAEAGIQTKNKKGIPTKGWHSIRVRAISKMLESGIPLATVQSLVGHVDAQMTQHYYRMDFDKALKAVETLEQKAVETITIPKTEYERLCRIEALYNALG